MSKRLTEAYARTVRKPGRHTFPNEDGLCLVVSPSLRKRWVQRLMIGGSSTDLGLGGYPLVSLKEAREKAQANRKSARSGRDPREQKRTESVPTFAEAVGRVIAFNHPTWANAKHASQWAATLRTYASPYFGDRSLDDISSADVMKALTPIWTDKPETARRVRQRISAVMKWAMANGFRTDNPAGDAIEAALPKTPRVKTHMPALSYAEVPQALEVIRKSTARPVTRLALEFLILTAARSGEVRVAKWDEISGDVWTIPAARMKARREHRVPLSRRASEILAQARELGVGGVLIFPSLGGKPMSDMTLTSLLRRLRISCVPHGFRSSFRDWAAECTDTPHAVMEAALAHVVGNSTEAAYFRSDLFERRRGLMDAWATYSCTLS